jgi:preflagellin peptidase FlaK
MFDSILDPRVILALATLGIGSYMDLRYREVSDLLWIIAAVLGLALHIIYPLPLLEHAYSIALGSVTVLLIALVAYRVGLFGGADAFALITMLVLLPMHEKSMFPTLSILLNACIIAVTSSILYNIIRNTMAVAKGINIFEGFNEPLAKKILAFIIAQRIDKAGRHYAFIAESNTSNGKRFDLSLKHAEYSSYVNVNGNGVWAIVGLPFILYILVGLVTMLTVGDIFTTIITSMIKTY